ncbi:MAG: hypothetical protein Crog4KO_24610 [Crocinitomicaceae bacterium]
MNQNQQKNTTNQEKEDGTTEKDDFDDEQHGTVPQIDLFQAFSLVNVQLRWKDFHEEKTEKSFRKAAKKQNLEINEAVATSELFQADQLTAALPISNNVFYISGECDDETVVATLPGNLQIQANTIAFILNCGTYPYAQS